MNAAPNNRAGLSGRPQYPPYPPYVRQVGPYLVPTIPPQAYQLGPSAPLGPPGEPQAYTRRVGPFLVPAIPPQGYPFGAPGGPQTPNYYQVGQHATLGPILGFPGSGYVPTRGGQVHKEEAFYRRVQSLMDFLSLVNVDVIAANFKLMTIDSQERLQGVVDMVYKAAIQESAPNSWPEMYALLVKEIFTLPVSGTADKCHANFLKLIVGRCQAEFDSYLEKDELNEFRSEIECADSETEQALLELLEEDMKMQMKSIRNIRFMGKLFKHGLLPPPIMLACLKRLLEQKEDESFQCLHALLTESGKKLEDNEELNDIFEQIQKILNENSSSKRVRFLFQDVINLRANNWVSWREETGGNGGSPENRVYSRDFLMKLQEDPSSKIKPSNLPDLDVVLDSTKVKQQTGWIPKNINTISRLKEVKLRECDNAWKPMKLAASDLPEDEAATQNLYKKVRCLLNKLTLEKFETLVSRIHLLGIDTKERMDGVINLVFEKAIDEPNFCAAYALMCKELALKQVSDTEPGSVADFKKCITTRCQLEFEKNHVNEKFRETMKAREIEKCTDAAEKKELQARYEEEERRIRLKSVNNIRFIGELFKQGLLTRQIMHFYINHLLQHRDEENLECLCKLLTTIGKDLETDAEFKGYIKAMQSIVNDRGPDKISYRIRFMIQDVIVLSSNKWVPKRDTSYPGGVSIKRIPRNTLQNYNMDYYRRFNRGMGGGSSEDDGGWIHPCRRRTAYVETLNLNSIPLSISNLQSRGRNVFQRYGNLMSEFRSSQAGSYQLNSGYYNSNKPERSADDIKNLINWVVEEYVAEGNCEKALWEIKENFSSSQLPMLVREMVNTVIEKSSMARERISKLLSFLLVNKAITLNDFRAGFGEILEIIGVTIIDIPEIWTYLAYILMHLIMDETHPVSELKSTVATLRSKGLSGKLIGVLFSNLSKIIGKESAAEKWRQSGLQFSDIINTERENVDKIIKKYELQFLSSECNDLENKAVSNKFEKFEEKLKNLTTMIVEENAAKGNNQGIPESNSPRCPELYARMVKEIITMPISGTSDFLKVILGMCQAEFDSYFMKEDSKCVAAKKIKKCADPEKKQELQELLEEEEVKMRMISIRNIWFMGELFKHGILPPPMMLACLKRLLEQKDDDSLEFLHKLVVESGEKLEIAEELNDVFEQMQKIIKEKGSTKKVRFLFQDLINMRANNWFSGKNESIPKVAKNIPENAEAEEVDWQLKYLRLDDLPKNRLNP